ncbi:hypothetical protein B0H14DRAFT_3477139 [Mycena olivaceomarginata]|nr:hypothetical protein B0H14DRAFT_3477139 [Mycena olivaceomarginata]
MIPTTPPDAPDAAPAPDAPDAPPANAADSPDAPVPDLQDLTDQDWTDILGFALKWATDEDVDSYFRKREREEEDEDEDDDEAESDLEERPRKRQRLAGEADDDAEQRGKKRAILEEHDDERPKKRARSDTLEARNIFERYETFILDVENTVDRDCAAFESTYSGSEVADIIELRERVKNVRTKTAEMSQVRYFISSS